MEVALMTRNVGNLPPCATIGVISEGGRRAESAGDEAEKVDGQKETDRWTGGGGIVRT